MSEPLISIIMPVHNCRKYIKDAIESILNQTYKNFELIIMDYASSDGTSELIKSYTDSRINYRTLEKIGIAVALNYGLSLANGDLIARMDGDDIMVHNKLQKQYDFLNQNKDVHLVGTNFYYIDKQGKKLFYKRFPEHHNDIEFSMPITISILHPTILTYKEVLLKVGKYNEKFTDSEDNELFLRMLEKGNKMYNLQEPLYSYRIRTKTPKVFVSQKENAYKLGMDYLTRYYTGKDEKDLRFEKTLRLGLLEYYNGSISKSRKYFLACIQISPLRFKKVLRYLPLTLLGEKVFNYIRESGISSAANRILNKIFIIDTYKVRS